MTETHPVIGSIRILETLGEGGMGVVYAGFDEKLQRKVALKRLIPAQTKDPELKARLLREARILSKLDHPHICNIYDYLESTDGDYIVLEFIEGRTLDVAIENGLTHQQAIDIASQISTALVAAHAEGVVHRDLKPGNVMLTAAEKVKVLDFGIARHTKDIDQTDPEKEGRSTVSDLSFRGTAQGSILGTLGYMSPEQAVSDVVTPASDMYAFGLLLQAMFTGRAPYDTNLPPRVLLARTIEGTTLPVNGINRQVTELINSLKATNPTERPTAVETAQRLRWIRERPRRLLRRAGLAMIGILAVAGVIKYTVDLSLEKTRAVQARDEAVLARAQAEGLVGFMIEDLYSALEPVGRLDLLDQVAGRARDYYNSTADPYSGEESLDAALAMIKAASVAESQGQLDAANETLRLAEKTFRYHFENLPSEDAHAGLVTTLTHLSEVVAAQGDLDAAINIVEEAVSLGEDLFAIDENNDSWRLILALACSVKGNTLGYRGENQQAEIDLRRAIGILLRHGASPNSWKLVQAEAHLQLGDVLEAQGDLDAALVSIEEALTLLAGLVQQDAGNAVWRELQGRAHYRKGNILEAGGNANAALQAYNHALEIEQYLVERDSTNAAWRRKLADYHSRVGRALTAKNQFNEALAAHLEAVVIYEQLVQANPSNAAWRNNLAWNHVLLGRIHAATGKIPQAQREWKRAVVLIKEVAQQSGDIYLLDTLAMALLHLDRVEEALPIVNDLLAAGWSDPNFILACRSHGLVPNPAEGD